MMSTIRRGQKNWKLRRN